MIRAYISEELILYSEKGKNKIKACSVCKTVITKNMIHKVNDHVSGDAFQILYCEKCQLHFTSPVPENMEVYYPLKYREYGPLAITFLHFFYNFHVSKWAKLTDKPGRALEIGCGKGFMLDALKRRGWDVVGIERTKEMVAYAKNILKLNVVSKEISQFPKEQEFDLIILFNSLEHMLNPESMLKECSARLKPGGLLVVTVPNFGSWQAKFAGRYWVHLDPPRHLFHFCQRSLINLMKKSGFNIYRVGFVSFEHDPFGWIQSTINKITGQQNILTRYLMGIEHFNFMVFLSIILSAILILPSVLLSIVSWIAGQGSIMEITAIRHNKD